jgi:hypothetical protein
VRDNTKGSQTWFAATAFPMLKLSHKPCCFTLLPKGNTHTLVEVFVTTLL